MKPKTYYVLFMAHDFSKSVTRMSDNNPICIVGDSPSHFLPVFTSLKKARKWTKRENWHLIKKMTTE